jgi:hypothetical protein
MRLTATILRWLIRLTGVVQIVLGLTFWTGNELQLIPVHMMVGLTLTIAFEVLAFVALFAGLRREALIAIGWGVVVPVLGMKQASLLVGDFHWIVQVIHLLVGVGAIGQAERLASSIRARRPAAAMA